MNVGDFSKKYYCDRSLKALAVFICFIATISGQESIAMQDVANECAKKASTFVNLLQFNKAHQEFVKCLAQGSGEAHFELARMLLFEIKWSRRTYVRKESRTAQDEAALKRELPYYGVIRLNSRQYILQLPYSRTQLIQSGEFYGQITAASEQFDYLRLILHELDEYLQSKPLNAKKIAIAKEWLRVLRPMAGNSSYKPWVDGVPSVEVLLGRLKDDVELMKAIEERRLLVE